MKNDRKRTKRPKTDSKNTLLASIDMAAAGKSRFHDELGRFITGHPGVQKRYVNAEDLKREIISYFDHCEQAGKFLTMTGLAIALGFKSRSALVNYEREQGYEFAFEVIQYAKMKIEEDTEQRLHDPRNYNISGAIFSLKNNWGWQDRHDIRMDQRKISIKGMEWIKPEELNGNSDGE
jgi:hypothetical protein